MMNWIPVLGAFTAVGGMIAFLVYCGREIDAEENRVKNYQPKPSVKVLSEIK